MHESPRPLPPGQQLVAAEKWPFVGERWPRPDNAPWTVSLGGLVRRPMSYSLTQLLSRPQFHCTADIHCVTRWSKLSVKFSGVLLSDLLLEAEVLPDAKFLSFIARSERAHSTSMALEDAVKLGSLLALHCENEPLPVEHGGPVRMVVPERYFYKSVKWLERIELLADDRLGYWEDSAGYHNEADPWREQRYIAAEISKQEAAKLIAARDFRGRELRGISASRRELHDLDAEGATLRDADFRDSQLANANFRGANLSNAHFAGAMLFAASFAQADCEGADFAGADLRGVDFTGASLFGATFCDSPARGADLDSTTQIADTQIDSLTPLQAIYVRRMLLAPR